MDTEYDNFIAIMGKAVREYYYHTTPDVKYKPATEMPINVLKKAISNFIQETLKDLRKNGFVFDDIVDEKINASKKNTEDEKDDESSESYDDESDYGSEDDESVCCCNDDESIEEENDTNPIVTDVDEQFCKLAFTIYQQDKYKFTQILFVKDSTHCDNYNGIVVDFELIKNLNDNVKECFCEIYILNASEDAYLIDNEPINMPYDCDEYIYQSLSNVEDAFLFYKHLNIMRASMDGSKIDKTISEELVKKVETHLLEVRDKIKQERKIKDQKREAEEEKYRLEQIERDNLKREDEVAYYEKYGIGIFEQNNVYQRFIAVVNKFVLDDKTITHTYLERYHQLSRDFYDNIRENPTIAPNFAEFDETNLNYLNEARAQLDVIEQQFNVDMQKWNRIFAVIRRSDAEFEEKMKTLLESTKRLSAIFDNMRDARKPTQLDILFSKEHAIETSSSSEPDILVENTTI